MRRGRARQLGAWNRDGTTGSWHYAIDPDETIQCSWDSYVCWHAPPNPHSLGNEMCENPTWNPARWLGRNHRKVLRRTAELTARQCLAYDIPIRWLTVADLRAGRRGITSHHNVTKAFRQSTHTDPRAWPRRKFMRMVRDEAAKLTSEGDWFDMATKDELREVVREELERVVGDVVDVPQNEIDAGVGRPGNDKVAVRTALTRIMRNTRDILNGERPAGK